MNMIVSVKSLLQQLRDDGWEALLVAATSFCIKREIPVPSLDETIPQGVTQGVPAKCLVASITTRLKY